MGKKCHTIAPDWVLTCCTDLCGGPPEQNYARGYLRNYKGLPPGSPGTRLLPPIWGTRGPSVRLQWFPMYLSETLPSWSHRRDSVSVLPIPPALPHHVARISALSHRREPSQGHWAPLAEAVLDLGAVTGIPQSSNYCHLVWVSDLEQGAGQHAVSRCQQTNRGQSCDSS